MEQKKKTPNTGLLTFEKMDNRRSDSVGSSRIRMRWMLPYWEDAEEFIIGKHYEVQIYQKVYWEDMMRQFKGIQILDLCDPDWLEGRDVFKFIDIANAVVTSTQTLADYILKFRPNAKVICIPDRVELKEHTPKVKHEGLIKKAAWFGYSHNIHYLEQTFDELIKNNIELTVISNEQFNPTFSFRSLKLKNIPYAYPQVHEELVKNDIMLLPEPSGDEKGKFKSNNKVLTAWALGMPVVKTADDLDRFMDAKERNIEAKLRREEVERDWGIEKSVIEYKGLINSLLSY